MNVSVTKKFDELVLAFLKFVTGLLTSSQPEGTDSDRDDVLYKVPDRIWSVRAVIGWAYCTKPSG